MADLLMVWHGEVPPADRGLYAPMPAPPCDYDDFDCEDLTPAAAQACLDYCWAQAGYDIRRLDSAGADLDAAGLER